MLLSLHIDNFGLVDRLEIELPQGLNVLTGETGAGKSIILSALQVALGGRAAPSEQVRTGADKMKLQAVFDVEGNGNLPFLLQEHGVEAPEDQVLIMTREVSRSGKGICRLNGQPVPLALYRSVGRTLVDFHMQHEQHSLPDQNRQLSLLDRLGGPELLAALKQVEELYHQWRRLAKKLEDVSADAAEKKRQEEALRYAVREIEQIDPQPAEDEELAAEKRVLANVEKISQLALEARGLLYDGDNRHCAADLLSGAMDLLRSLAQLDQSRGPLYQSVENAFYQVEEVAGQLAVLLDEMERNPQRLEAVEERIILLGGLKKKYGATLTAVLDYYHRAKLELENLEQDLERRSAIERELESLENAYRQAAQVLSTHRKEAAHRLEKDMALYLEDLEMGRVRYQVAFHPVAGLSPNGAEQAEFLIAPNPGEPLKPLAKIASGGELSRIMLALKALLAEVDEVPVLVFDEADAGVGGHALNAVAEKLAQISAYHQILCVTHAPQIASYAAAHHLVRKEYHLDRTHTVVDLLNTEERVEELARMMTGKEITDISREHAGQMLARGQGKQ